MNAVLNYKQLIEIEEAKTLIEENLPQAQIEELDLSLTLDRIITEDITAPEPSPRFDNSAMDGYALHYIEGQDQYQVIGSSHAGIPFEGKAGEAIKISTGAQVPEWANTIIPIENLQENSDHTSIKVLKAPTKPKQHIRFRGEEIKKGDLLIKANTKISPANIACLASFGVAKIKVYKQTHIAVILTGTELADYRTQELEPGQIRDSNGIMLQSLIAKSQAQLTFFTRVEDDLESTIATLKKAEQATDIIIFSGGVSVGTRDFVQDAARACDFDIVFWKIKQKPGKPLLFARKNDTILFGLPGNPVSSLICYCQYIDPAIKKIQGGSYQIKSSKAKLQEDLLHKGDRANFLRLELEEINGELFARPIFKQGSHMLSSSSSAQGYTLASQSLKQGEEVEVFYFPW